MTSYIVGFDQYNQAAGTYSIDLETFVHNSGDPNFNTAADFTASGVVTAVTLNGLTGGRTTLPASFINSAGPNNGYLLGYAENSAPHGGQDYIKFLSFNQDGTANLNFGPGNQGFFEIAPDLLAYGQHTAGDTTVHNKITLEAGDGTNTGQPTSLLLCPARQRSDPCTPRGTRPSPLTAVPLPTTRLSSSVTTNPTPVDQYFTYQIADGHAQNIKIQINPYNGVLGTGTMVFLGYGDNLSTTVVEYFFNSSTNATTQIGTYTEATPNGQEFNTIRDLGDGRMAVTYDDQLDARARRRSRRPSQTSAPPAST